jgi:hypothetical protein
MACTHVMVGDKCARISQQLSGKKDSMFVFKVHLVAHLHKAKDNSLISIHEIFTEQQ